MAMRRGNLLCIWRQTPSPETHPQPLPPKGGEWNAQGRRQARRPRPCTFSWGLHVANNCRVVACIRLWGPCLASDCRGRASFPIAETVLAGPKVTLGRFSMTRLQPHVGRTPNFEQDRDGTRHCLYSWFSAISLFLP